MSQGLLVGLSVKQPYASALVEGRKTIEVRSQPTHYRGPLWICSSAKPDVPAEKRLGAGGALGSVLGLVEVYGSHLFGGEEDVRRALVRPVPGKLLFSWEVRPVLKLESPIPIKGRLGLFSIEKALQTGGARLLIDLQELHFLERRRRTEGAF